MQKFFISFSSLLGRIFFSKYTAKKTSTYFHSNQRSV